MKALSAAFVVAAANTILEDKRYADRRFQGEDEFALASAAFVNHIGYHAHRTGGRSNWLFSRRSSVVQMARQAARDGVLHQDQPRPGEIFLKWSVRLGKFIGAGIVLEATRRVDRDERAGFIVDLCAGSAHLVPATGAEPLESVIDWAMHVRMETIPLRTGDRFICWEECDFRDAAQPHVITRGMGTRPTAPAWASRWIHEGK